MVISDRKNKAEETPVLIPPPENVMFPPMLFKTSSLSGTKYRMDEEGNVLLKNDDEALYKMTPLKELGQKLKAARKKKNLTNTATLSEYMTRMKLKIYTIQSLKNKSLLTFLPPL